MKNWGEVKGGDACEGGKRTEDDERDKDRDRRMGIAVASCAILGIACMVPRDNV